MGDNYGRKRFVFNFPPFCVSTTIPSRLSTLSAETVVKRQDLSVAVPCLVTPALEDHLQTRVRPKTNPASTAFVLDLLSPRIFA